MLFDIKRRVEFFEISACGVLDSSKFKNLFKALFAHDEWETGSPILYDYSNLAVGDLQAYEMKEIIHLCEMWRVEVGRGKCGMVVPKDEQYVFARMFMRRAMFKWDVDIEAFRSRETALHWLLDDASTQYMYCEDGTPSKNKTPVSTFENRGLI